MLPITFDESEEPEDEAPVSLVSFELEPSREAILDQLYLNMLKA